MKPVMATNIKTGIIGIDCFSIIKKLSNSILIFEKDEMDAVIISKKMVTQVNGRISEALLLPSIDRSIKYSVIPHKKKEIASINFKDIQEGNILLKLKIAITLITIIKNESILTVNILFILLLR